MKTTLLIILASIFSFDQTKLDKVLENDQLLINYSVTKEKEKALIIGEIWDKTQNPKIPFEGMNIVLKDHPVGTVSNKMGKFKLEVKVKSGTIHMSFVGYKSVELKFQ